MKRPSTKAQRQLAMMQLRAEAASVKAVQLALLAMSFGQRMIDLQRTHRGDALDHALTALMREQRAAEKALIAKLEGEAAERRKAMSAVYSGRSQAQRLAAAFKTAAKETTRRRALIPGRPRERARGTRAPRLRR